MEGKKKKKREEKRINDTCKRPVEFPRLAIFDVADGIRMQEERARQAGREGGVGVWPKTKRVGLYMKCVCTVCLGYVHYIQSYVIWTIQRFNAKCICPRRR